MDSPLIKVRKLGQSIWYNNIRRGFITSGELQSMVDHDALLGVTSNPAIFEKALAGSTDYESPVPFEWTKTADEVVHKEVRR